MNECLLVENGGCDEQRNCSNTEVCSERILQISAKIFILRITRKRRERGGGDLDDVWVAAERNFDEGVARAPLICSHGFF